jgi:hypothetical protein
MNKYNLPPFLDGTVTERAYLRWLARKASAHVKRDRNRGNSTAIVELYKTAIHQAVCASNGIDAYTREALAWDLISTYNNEESKAGKRVYKAKFALLPTVDHIGDGLGVADFKICSWRTNDAKGDLSLSEFIDLCERVFRANPKTMTAAASKSS